MIYLLSNADFNSAGEIRPGAGSARTDSQTWQLPGTSLADLSNELILAIVMSSTCPHCVNLIPEIDKLAKLMDVAEIKDDGPFIARLQTTNTPFKNKNGAYTYNGVPIIAAFKYGRYIGAYSGGPRTAYAIYQWVAQYASV